jgi:hypothetical protein
MKILLRIIFLPIIIWFIYLFVLETGRTFIYYPDGQSLTVYSGMLFDGEYYKPYISNVSVDYVFPIPNEEARLGSYPILVKKSASKKCKFIVPKEYQNHSYRNNNKTFCFEENSSNKDYLSIDANGPISFDKNNKDIMKNIKIIDIGGAYTQAPLVTFVWLYYLIIWIGFSILSIIVYILFMWLKRRRGKKCLQ